MLGYLRLFIGRSVAAFCSRHVKQLLGEIAAVNLDRRDLRGELAVLRGLTKSQHGAICTHAATRENAERAVVELTSELGQATKSIEALNGLLLAAGERDAAAVDRESRVRTELADVQEALSDAKHEIQMLGHQLECAEAHNNLLSEIHSTDVERRKKERAIEIRQQVEAETASRYALNEAADAA
jgi:chromosome segregation ATPase